MPCSSTHKCPLSPNTRQYVKSLLVQASAYGAMAIPVSLFVSELPLGNGKNREQMEVLLTTAILYILADTTGLHEWLCDTGKASWSVKKYPALTQPFDWASAEASSFLQGMEGLPFVQTAENALKNLQSSLLSYE